MTVSVMFLHLQLSQKSVLVVLGNLAPGFIAVVMELLNEDIQFRSLRVQLRPPKSSKLLYAFAIFAPLTINLAMFMAQENLSLNAFVSLHMADFGRLFLVNILLAPLWEEIGWRGFLLPTLSKQIGLGRASLLVGFVWGSWHFVLYHSVLRVPVASFLISLGVIVAMSVVLAVLYSASGNTLLLPILFHTSWNASTNWVIGAEPRYDLGPIVLQAVRCVDSRGDLLALVSSIARHKELAHFCAIKTEAALPLAPDQTIRPIHPRFSAFEPLIPPVGSN